MTDDVVFMTPGQQPFGKDAFAAASQQAADFSIDGKADIVELRLLHGWAFTRNRLQITITPSNSIPMRRCGYTLTLLRKCAEGRRRILRDANLTTADVS